MGFTWSDGDPTAVTSDTRTGVFRYSTDPLDFSVAATTDARELRVYVATDAATASVTFSLSDGSAPAVAAALPVPGTSPGAGHRPQLLTAAFRSATSTARLNVRFVKTSGNSTSLFAATLR